MNKRNSKYNTPENPNETEAEHYLKILQTGQKCLKILEENGYIEKKYSVVKDKEFCIEQNICGCAVPNVLKIKSGALRGALYMYLNNECGIKQDDLKLIFPQETRSIADLIREYKKKCSLGDDCNETKEDIIKRDIAYLKKTFK